METLGYRNAQKVMRLSAEGKFLTMFRGNPHAQHDGIRHDAHYGRDHL